MKIERVEYVWIDGGGVHLFVTIDGVRELVPGDFPTRLLDDEGIVPVIGAHEQFASWLPQSGGPPVLAVRDPALVAVIRSWAEVRAGGEYTLGDQSLPK